MVLFEARKKQNEKNRMHEQTLQKRNFVSVSELQNVSSWFMGFVPLKNAESFFLDQATP